MVKRKATVSVVVRVGRHTVLHSVQRDYEGGRSLVRTQIDPAIDRVLLGQVLLVSAAEILPPEFRVKCISMLAALSAIQQERSDTEIPF